MTDVRLRALSLALAALVLAAAGAAACGSDEARLQVAAASDLRPLLEENRSELESAAGMPIAFVFGSSGQLQEQVLAGAKYAILLSADVRYVDILDDAGRVAADGRANYGVGSLALVWRDGVPDLSEPGELRRSDLERITIANPGHAPYGRAAQETLTTLGLWEELQPRIVLAEHVRQATDYVQTGNADAGLVALALVVRGNRPFVLIDRRLHKPIVQAGAVIAGSGQEQAARQILEFLLGSRGRELLAEYGFEPPP